MGAPIAGRFAPLRVAAVHPAHLGACLPRLSDATIRRLQACRRLDGALGEMLAARGGAAAWIEPDLSGPARLALAGRDEIERAATVMGAIWHATPVRLCIGGDAVSLLVAEIGAEARAAALRHAALGVAAPEPMPPRELAAAVARSADACLDAWLATLPGGVRQGVLFKLPPRGPAADGELHEKAGAIIAAAVDAVLGERALGDAGQ